MGRRSDRKFRRWVLRDGKTVMFTLVGKEGAATFNLERVNELSDVLGRKQLEGMGVVFTDAGLYMGTDVGVHYRTPVESFSHMEDCVALDGKECWYAGSTSHAIELARQWEEAGFDEKLIRYALEGVYEAEFTDGE
jgi:hypothetical protein